jgi:glutamate synthase domain-containing protein 3
MVDTTTVDNASAEIDARGMTYRQLNLELTTRVQRGAARIVVRNVNGQRYIGTNLNANVQLDLWGTPGNDLGAFMNGPHIVVHGNGQDGIGNTMNGGEIVIHGHAGDALGLAARGGTMLVRDGAGYRAGIHMKEYDDARPVVVIGGTAQDFLGEYMAGGVLVVLGLVKGVPAQTRARYVGTGMHGGRIFLRGTIESHQLGKEVGVAAPDSEDMRVLENAVRLYCENFDRSVDEMMSGEFIKLFPLYLRPYGRLYAY